MSGTYVHDCDLLEDCYLTEKWFCKFCTDLPAIPQGPIGVIKKKRNYLKKKT